MWSVKVSASLNLSQISGVENDHTTGTLSVHWATYLLRWQKKRRKSALERIKICMNMLTLILVVNKSTLQQPLTE